MRHAEALFLVDHDQPEPLELDRLRQDRVRADDQVDRAVGQPFARRLGLRRADQPRQPPDLDREAFEARDEIVVMLAREQRGRADDRDLLARHRGGERGAQRDLGLAEPDIADHQPVHRLARREIAEHVVDRAVLVVGFLVREAVDERGIAALVGLDHVAGMERAFGGGRDQLAGDLADALLHAALAPLPRLAAEPVERAAFFRPVAAQDFEILDRNVELVAAGIGQRDAIVRRLLHRDLGQPLVAPDAVIGVDDEIAGRQRRELGEEGVGRFLAPVAPHQPVAEHVLLGQQRDARRGEAVVERQDGQRDAAIRRAECFLPGIDQHRAGQIVIAQQPGEPLARSGGVAREDRFLLVLAQLVEVFDHRFVDIDAARSLRRKVARTVDVEVDHGRAFGFVERRRQMRLGRRQLAPPIRRRSDRARWPGAGGTSPDRPTAP